MKGFHDFFFNRLRKEKTVDSSDVFHLTKFDLRQTEENATLTVVQCTVPSGGNVTCLEGSRQRGNGIPARQLCRIFKQFESCLDPCEART